MDNYYNLFKGDSSSSRKTTRRSPKRSSHRSRMPRRGHAIHFDFKIIKILFSIIMVGIIAFLLLMIFSSNLTYESASENNIENYIKELTKSDRLAGTDNEINAAKYINAKMTEWGYDSRLDGFEIVPYDGKTFARNVIATKEADNEYDTGDILILTSHFDSEGGSFGANDNASGTAALLELANVLKDEKTDTKVIYVFLSATYENERGAQYFINTFGQDKEKIIGIIDIDKIGIDTKPLFKIVTSDLKHTCISEILDDYFKKITKNSLEVTYNACGTHVAFTKEKIPAFTLTSKANSMYDGLSLDSFDKLNTSNIKKVTDVLENTLRQIIKYSTSSYLTDARARNEYNDKVFIMTKDTEIPFGSSKEVVEDVMKFKGTFAGTDQNANKDIIDSYSYQMKWFNEDTLFITKYEYINKCLAQVKIEMYEKGVNIQDALKFISRYLELDYKREEVDGCVLYKFEDVTGRKLYTIEEKENKSYSVVVTNYYSEDTIYKTSELYDEISKNNNQGQSRDEKLLSLIAKILMPRDIKRVNKYITFTDGIGYKKGYVMPEDKLNNNSKFTFAIDIDDAFDSDDNYRNYKETIEKIINNYAYILALNESQVTLTESPSPDMVYLFDNGVYQEESYLKLFRAAFFKPTKKVVTVNNVKANEEEIAAIEESEVKDEIETGNAQSTNSEIVPKHVVSYVNEIDGNEVMNDFAKTFTAFVLLSQDDAKAMSNNKVLFFYNFEELVNIREYIRNNLGL